MTTVLITGASGQLGMSLKKIFNSKYEIISTTGNNISGVSSIYLDVTKINILAIIIKNNDGAAAASSRS